MNRYLFNVLVISLILGPAALACWLLPSVFSFDQYGWVIFVAFMYLVGVWKNEHRCQKKKNKTMMKHKLWVQGVPPLKIVRKDI